MRSRALAFLICIITFSNFWAQKTWDGGGTDNNFSTADNWDDDTAPASGDTYVFDATSTKSCVVDIPIDATSFSVNSGFTGIIDMGVDDHAITGNFSIASGTVISTTGRLDFFDGDGTFSLSGSGVFLDNGGIIGVESDVSENFTFSGNLVLNMLELFEAGSTTERIVNFGSNLTTNTISLITTSTRIYAYQGTIHVKSTLNLGNASQTSNSSNNTANFIFDGNSALLVGSSSAGSGKAILPNIEINTTGNYTISNSINLRGNWTGTQGTLSVGSSTVNFHTTASISGTAAAFNNLTVHSGVTLTFPSNAEVMVARNLVNNGTITAGATSLLSMNGGSTAQSISGSAFVVGSLRGVTGNRTITLSTPVTVLDSVKLEDDVELASGGNLTLNSDANLKARLAQLGSSASVTGNVTVETFLTSGSAGWMNLGSPGVENQTLGMWDGQIPMTCFGCTYDSTVITPPFTSLWQWDEPSQSYLFGLASTAMTPGLGFFVYVATDLFTANDFTLTNSNTLAQNNVNVNYTNNFGTFPLTLIANPYPCPISWDKVYADNSGSGDLSAAIYAWNAEANDYSIYTANSSTSNVAGFEQNGIIASGQGFFVEHIGFSSPSTITFQESHKHDNNSYDVFKQNTAISSKVNLNLIASGGETHNTVLHFHPSATENYDGAYDARKIFVSPGYAGYPGSYSKYNSISTKWKGRDYAVNTLPELTKTYTVPLLVKVSVSGTYTIDAGGFQNFNSCLLLIDHLTNTYHNLMQGPYVFSIEDSTSVPRFDVIVCESGVANPTQIMEEDLNQHISIFQTAASIYVNTRFEKENKISISAYNLLGQKLMNDMVLYGAETSTKLPIELSNQVIFIQVNSEKESVTKKLILH